MATSSRHRSSRKGGGLELVVAAGWAVLLIVIVVLSAWASRSFSTVRPTAPHSAAAQPASSKDLPLAVGTRLQAWFTDAKPSIVALFGAADNLVTAARYGDIAATGAACQTTAGAVANVQHHLPSPDPALNIDLQQAVTSYREGIRHCVSGAQNRDPVEIGEAKVYTNRGSTELQAAVGVIEDDLSADARDHRVWTV